MALFIYRHQFFSRVFSRLGVIIILWLTSALCGVETLASESDRPFPTRVGFSVSFGHIYDPNAERGQLTLFTCFLKMDHDRTAFFDTPDYLRSKIELTLGSGWNPPWEAMVAVNMLSLCYIDPLSTETLRPYVEGGIGGIYTKQRWEGQGLNFLHNPVAGAGVLISSKHSSYSQQISLRLFHMSNGRLHKDNKAMNAVLLSAGFIF